MVSRAENTGQVLTKAKQGFPGAFVLQTPGTAPVLTFGRASETPARIWLKPSESEENAFFALWMRDGTWEIELRDGRIHLTCDTPNLKGKALGNWIKTGTGVVEILPNGTQKAATELPAQTRRLR